MLCTLMFDCKEEPTVYNPALLIGTWVEVQKDATHNCTNGTTYCPGCSKVIFTASTMTIITSDTITMNYQVKSANTITPVYSGLNGNTFPERGFAVTATELQLWYDQLVACNGMIFGAANFKFHYKKVI